MASIFDNWDNFQRPVQRQNPGGNSTDTESVALFNSASRGNADRVRSILDNGVADAGYLVNGFNALHIACKKGHLDVVKTLLTMRPNSSSTRTCDNRTPCMLACFEGHFDVAKLFADSSYKLQRNPFNDVDSKSNLPYHYAARGGHVSIVKFIINLATSIDHINDSSLDNLDVLPDDNYYLRKLFHPLLPNAEGLTAIDMAAIGNYSEVIECIISSLGEFERIDDCAVGIDDELEQRPSFVLTESNCASGQSPLHRAAQYGSLAAIKSLIQSYGLSGEVINCRSANGFTPLHLACLHGHNDIVKYLVCDCGATINAQSSTLLTPLHMACVGGYLNVVQFLIGNGAISSMKTESNSSALHLAAGNGRHEICQILSTELDIEILETNNEGQTPIDAALQSGYNKLATQIAGFGYIQHKTQAIISSYVF